MNFFSEKTAKAISYLFHPLLMPTFGLFIMFSSGTYLSFLPVEGERLIYLIIFSGTFLVPLCFVPLYFYFKIIRNAEMDTAQQRFLPLIITLTAYCCTFYLMRKIPIPFINGFILACCISLLLNAFILLRWKISSHLIGLGGLVGLLIALNIRLNADIILTLIMVLLVSGVVAASRLKLAAHSPSEVYGGFFLGMLVVASLLVFV